MRYVSVSVVSCTPLDPYSIETSSDLASLAMVILHPPPPSDRASYFVVLVVQYSRSKGGGLGIRSAERRSRVSGEPFYVIALAL